jgi:hypothetical protein
MFTKGSSPRRSLPLLLIALVSLSLPGLLVQAQESSAVSNDDIQACAAAMVQVDVDQDGRVNRAEYINLMQIISPNPSCPGSNVFNFLGSATFSTLFVDLACRCLTLDVNADGTPTDQNCCAGNKQHMKVPGVYPLTYTTDVCGTMLRTIESECPAVIETEAPIASPTVQPTRPPTRPPSSFPTASPTKSPVQTFQPTVEPTVAKTDTGSTEPALPLQELPLPDDKKNDTDPDDVDINKNVDDSDDDNDDSDDSILIGSVAAAAFILLIFIFILVVKISRVRQRGLAEKMEMEKITGVSGVARSSKSKKIQSSDRRRRSLLSIDEGLDETGAGSDMEDHDHDIEHIDIENNDHDQYGYDDDDMVNGLANDNSNSNMNILVVDSDDEDNDIHIVEIDNEGQQPQQQQAHFPSTSSATSFNVFSDEDHSLPPGNMEDGMEDSDSDDENNNHSKHKKNKNKNKAVGPLSWTGHEGDDDRSFDEIANDDDDDDDSVANDDDANSLQESIAQSYTSVQVKGGVLDSREIAINTIIEQSKNGADWFEFNLPSDDDDSDDDDDNDDDDDAQDLGLDPEDVAALRAIEMGGDFD